MLIMEDKKKQDIDGMVNIPPKAGIRLTEFVLQGLVLDA